MAGRPPVWSWRQLIDGIRFRVRTGVPWRDVPVEYGPWGRICALFRRWQRDGIWHQVLTRLQALADAKGAIVWDLSVDPTVCRAHQHATGARKQGDLQKEPPGGVFDEPGDHGLGVLITSVVNSAEVLIMTKTSGVVEVSRTAPHGGLLVPP
ncbi:transposase [Streptomyces roseochromogenus]|uniref:transposase n=1 Tax=Streptomyces roseochromogenus TaxID=285450 RepID=UPI000AFE18F3|nr:transposase [Streptomyces roseochromogenus]